MKRQVYLILAFFMLFSGLLAAFQPMTAKAFDPNILIDDELFNLNSMDAAGINTFLNTFPNSCISPNSGFEAVVPAGYSPSGGFIFGDFVSAGQVIATAAQVYGINPQVLLVTLQKEQSLVAGGVNYCNNGDEHKYASAAGYGCPDSGTVHNWSGVSLYRRHGVERTVTGSTCVNSITKAGFSQQVIRAAWLLKFGQQRSLGNLNWAVITGTWNNSDDPPTSYGGPMTQGNLKRCQGCAVTYFDGYTTIDGSGTYMGSGATAALYWYTPHFHGNENFVNLFTNWFGSTITAAYYSCKNGANIPGAPTGEHIIAKKFGINNSDNMSLIIPNNNGSKCIEAHTWPNGSYQSWTQHIASNYPAVNPNSHKILAADGNGDGVDELYKIDYNGTSSGMIEVHCWDNLLRRWISHIATNRPSVNVADAEVIAADPDGDRRDSLFLVEYRNNGSGRVEVHGWNGNLQQWTTHIATNYGSMNPADGQIIAADRSGEGQDEFYLVNYAGSSGRVEVHGWSSNFQQWVSHIATVSPSAQHVDGSNNSIVDVIAADMNGNGQDELYKVDYSGTGSGRVEVHGWTPNLQQWSSHVATNHNSF